MHGASSHKKSPGRGKVFMVNFKAFYAHFVNAFLKEASVFFLARCPNHPAPELSRKNLEWSLHVKSISFKFYFLSSEVGNTIKDQNKNSCHAVIDGFSPKSTGGIATTHGFM